MQDLSFAQSMQRSLHHPATRTDLASLRVMDTVLADASPDAVVSHLILRRHHRVYFFNAHCVNIKARDPAYSTAVAHADTVLPDGVGIEIAAKMTGQKLTANLNGTDFMPRVLRKAAQQGKSVFLLGGKPGTAERAAQRISADIPGLKVVGTRDGYGGAHDSEGAIRAINRSKAQLLLVAMGVPQQELWLERHGNKLNVDVMFAVGGLFDFWAGNVRRAPNWMRGARCEWVWRLMMEPRRMYKRYLIGNISFLWRAARCAAGDVTSYTMVKRVTDVGISLVALTSLAPVLLLLCAAIRVESRGSAMFKQQRIGTNGHPFVLFKLRTMRRDAEDLRADLLKQSDRDGICFKSCNDPRLTRLGRFLRRFSLDELPQLINVLRGEMSIVGPRPALPEEVAAYAPEDRRRLSVKPGLTGLWQVSGRADLGFDRMVEMDIAYAQSRSFLLDIFLIAATFRAVMSGRGAY